MRRRVFPLLALLLALAISLAGCSADTASDAGDGSGETASGSAEAEGGGSSDQQYPDVVEAELTAAGEGSYTLDVTVSSPYDSPERYADGWRVLDPEGEVLGEHELGHDHAGEQPFTRTQSGLEIPDGVETITVEGRDQENGYGGATVEIELS